MLSDHIMYWFSRPIVLTYMRAMLDCHVGMQQTLPKGPKIIAANHPTTTDPFFVAGMLRQQSFILINNLLFQVPVLGEYLRRSGHIPVIEGRGQEAIDAAVARLKAGCTVIIFPEGFLSPAHGFHPARTGVARLALMSGAPVVPVGIHLQRERAHTIRSTVRGQVEYGSWYLRGPYHLTIGRPLFFSGDVEDHPRVREIAAQVMHHIIELAHESKSRMRGAGAPPLPVSV
jgi:1-acyl-sn-glycerol-3-phosphate acyltransferase